jgi:hypothetical protein
MFNLMSSFWRKVIKVVVEIILDLIQKKGQN